MAIAWNDLNTGYRRVFNEGIWVAIGQTLRAIGMLVGVRLLTTWVAPEVYGKFSLLVGALALGTGVCCYPFLHAVHRFYYEASRSNSIPVLYREIQILLTYATCGLALVIITAGIVYTNINQSVTHVTTFILTMLLCAEVFSTYQTVCLTAARRQARYSSWVATESWLKPCAALIFIWLWQPSVEALLTGYVFGIGLTLLLFYRPLTPTNHGLKPLALSEQTRFKRQIISFALPLFPLALLGWISSVGDRYIIGGMLNYNAVGIYAAAYGVAFQPFNFAGAIVELTIRPVYFKTVSNREHGREKVTFRSWLIFTTAISMAGFGVVFFCHDWIAKFLLGQEFRRASDLLPWLSAGGVLFAVSQVLEKPFYAHMETRYVLYAQTWSATASVVLCFILIPVYGLKGAAISVPIYYGIQCLLLLYFNRSINKARV